MSREQKKYLFKYKLNKIIIFGIQVSLVIMLLVIWELFINNSFIFSSPSRIIRCIYELYKNNNLFKHIFITSYETIIAFIIGLLISIMLSTILYYFKNIYKILEPFLTLLNSMPKVALGPIIIIVCGANIRSVILMGILINVIVSTIVITNSFYNTSELKIRLLKTLGANKYQLFKYLIIPDNYKSIMSTIKLNISMSLIGVISGEFLVSKSGLGYLIIYGTQIFNMDLVISGIILLLIISFIFYKIIDLIEKR